MSAGKVGFPAWFAPAAIQPLGNKPALGADFIAGDICAAGEFHTLLGNESLEQFIHVFHELRVAMNLVRPLLLDGLDPHFLHIAGDNPGERAAQGGGQFLCGLIEMQIKVGHIFMAGIERHL